MMNGNQQASAQPGSACQWSHDIKDNTWTHLAAVRNSSGMVLYVNGVVDNSCLGAPGSKPRIVRCQSHNSDWSGYRFMIGNDPISGNRHFTGSIDEVYASGASC